MGFKFGKKPKEKLDMQNDSCRCGHTWRNHDKDKPGEPCLGYYTTPQMCYCDTFLPPKPAESGILSLAEDKQKAIFTEAAERSAKAEAVFMEKYSSIYYSPTSKFYYLAGKYLDGIVARWSTKQINPPIMKKGTKW